MEDLPSPHSGSTRPSEEWPRLTTACVGTLRFRGVRPGLRGLQGFPHPPAPPPAVVSQTSVPAFPSLGVSLILQFWAEARILGSALFVVGRRGW